MKQSYYILFKTYTDAMALQDILRDEDISSRISPTPRSIQGELGCGVSILISDEEIEKTKDVIKKHKAIFYDIVPLENQINPNRNRFC